MEAVDFSWILPELFAVAASTPLATIIGMAYMKIKEPILRETPTFGVVPVDTENINWFSDAEDVFEL